MSFALFVAIWLAFNLLFAGISAYVASRWGRDPFGWLIVGAVLGPFGLLVLLSMHRDDLHRSRHQLVGSGSRTGTKRRPRVLIAVDDPAASSKSARYVIDCFGTTLDEVAVLSVLPIELADSATLVEGSPRRRHLEEEINRHLGPAHIQLLAAGISCKSITRFGDPATEIIAFANEGHYDLVVICRRGRGTAGKLLLGSVADSVAKAASCPVAVV